MNRQVSSSVPTGMKLPILSKLGLAALLALSSLQVSCTSTYAPNAPNAPNAKNGAVLGGLLGAGAGALIGEHKGRELEGAAIGGALGALAGTAVGSARDDREIGYRGASYSSPHRYNDPYYTPHAPRRYYHRYPSYPYSHPRYGSHHHHYYSPCY